jgi:hypothetical protein
MKKIFITIIAMLLPLMASAYDLFDVEVGGIYYDLDTKTQQAKVTDNPNKYKGNVNIPPFVMYEGVKYDVKAIGQEAFQDCSDLTSVTIPNSVKSIDYAAFYGCTGLTVMNIPYGVETIGYSSFANCSGITTLTIPNSVTSIKNYAFYGCSGLTSVIVPSSVTSLGDGPFGGCTSLSSITIPNGITTLTSGFLSGCTSLTSVTIPNSVLSIGRSAFQNSGLTSITIPNSVTSIDADAFLNCFELLSVTIGDGVTSIGSKSFAACTKLTDVYCLAKVVPTTNSDAFTSSFIDRYTLHVPAALIESYKSTAPWSGFKDIIALDGETTQCAKPTIKVEDGILTFSSQTEGVTYVASYNFSNEETKKGGSQLVLAGNTICHVSVYATKEGYLNSETSTADVELNVGVMGDVDGDGKVNVADHVKLSDIILNRNK